MLMGHSIPTTRPGQGNIGRAAHGKVREQQQDVGVGSVGNVGER